MIIYGTKYDFGIAGSRTSYQLFPNCIQCDTFEGIQDNTHIFQRHCTHHSHHRSASSRTKTKKRSDQGFPMVATFSTSAISALPIDGHQTSPAPPLLTADQPVRMYQAFPSLKLFAWWRICFFGHQHFQRIDRVIAANFLLMPIDGRQTWAVPPWPTAH